MAVCRNWRPYLFLLDLKSILPISSIILDCCNCIVLTFSLLMSHTISFKDETELVYAKDTCTFFRDFLKYSIGQNIDNLQFLGAPSSNDKYDFYLNKQDILYLNDAYMDFFKSFYEKYLFQLNGSSTMNVYAAIASSDLTLTNTLLKEDNYLKDNQNMLVSESVILNFLKNPIDFDLNSG